ncbi:MarR family transcriptional regulator [Streptococcus macedonicus]|uniref:MarR family winged helix-turn-helix transcriptional regulator n=1 Tax=Streptococcus macedonicus TaxID=59310 RepID=UPI002243A8A9|nr:MarR family transcriptional regulator [Streptococcus macedonicus]MCW8519354.1 MarR family transcriptional regulator [Streptococcus macedonicus]MCW8521143.1 MarR family transcriptional regulator [Streptococcus macedonicus]
MTAIDFTIERLVLKAGNVLKNIRIGDLEKSRLTPAQSETILFYADNGGKSIKDLAIHLKVSHQAARKLVDKLKDKTILESVISKKDRRSTSIFLTSYGQEICTTLKQRGTTVGETILSDYSDDEKKLLLEFLRRIEKNIDDC